MCRFEEAHPNTPRLKELVTNVPEMNLDGDIFVLFVSMTLILFSSASVQTFKLILLQEAVPAVTEENREWIMSSILSEDENVAAAKISKTNPTLGVFKAPVSPLHRHAPLVPSPLAALPMSPPKKVPPLKKQPLTPEPPICKSPSLDEVARAFFASKFRETLSRALAESTSHALNRLPVDRVWTKLKEQEKFARFGRSNLRADGSKPLKPADIASIQEFKEPRSEWATKFKVSCYYFFALQIILTIRNALLCICY